MNAYDSDPWPSFLCDSDDDDINDADAARLVDLIYALGDFVATHFASRLSRHARRQRDNCPINEQNPDPRQMNLFPGYLLDPF
ncbi:uncharacterized protein E1O_30500 [Burkholderiales bacterium GJ-E10]|nr:uncharacterized protein E1O_03360 [Burkholderiales bacterium GJ-E10]BAP88017.1 uncharacterized protein E1O_08860 [Burkholderiales bacterium GJ-E10]BAP88172.1 uncharacterized protein E1O_10410 [Burkholderiales bacterium GJ-E10]BAP89833.1 uncharacterized protein E1O_27020 [Burkholderiales bacterium GJ-E10]BAP89841.1 uncharacterized protein E1O_27100 [Burkholderiales bacterium GJ-E10]